MSSRWTMVRRVVQLSMIALIASPLFGWTFFQGNLSSGTVSGITLTDPLAFLQATVASRSLVPSFLGSAAIVTVVYFLLGGRTFCAWICPVYLVCEAGEAVRRRTGKHTLLYPLSGVRWSFFTTLAVSVVAAVPLFEIVSPIGSISRAIMFGTLPPLMLVGAILIIEIALARRIWCRTLCPAGGYYSLLGRFSPVRIRFNKDACTACGECSQVCPVEEVLVPSLVDGAGMVVSGDCTRCGACVDVCRPRALRMGAGYALHEKTITNHKEECL